MNSHFQYYIKVREKITIVLPSFIIITENTNHRTSICMVLVVERRKRIVCEVVAANV